MGVCDICKSPGRGTLIGSEDLRAAVFKNGFNPLKLGLSRNVDAMAQGLKITPQEKERIFEGMYKHWREQVSKDQTDWNICDRCMAAIRPFLDGPLRPTSAWTVSGEAAGASMACAELMLDGLHIPKEEEKVMPVVLKGLFTGPPLPEIEKELVTMGIDHEAIREVMRRAGAARQQFGGMLDHGITLREKSPPKKRAWWNPFK